MAGYASRLKKFIEPIHYWRNCIPKNVEIVLFGDGSHGTKEFYEQRCNITKGLIEEGKCMGVLLESDFPDTSLLHRYVTHATPEISLETAMSGFSRFPTWMWKNYPIKNFVVWLHEHNRKLAPKQRCGIFGIDIYSLELSIKYIIQYFETEDPITAISLEDYYNCFNTYGMDPKSYSYLTSELSKLLKHEVNCCQQVKDALSEVLLKYKEGIPSKGYPVISSEEETDSSQTMSRLDELFAAKMNAYVVESAEVYYRSLSDPNISTWELRDTHFFQAMEMIRDHLKQTRSNNQVVVWAHNSHVGDARHIYTQPSPMKRMSMTTGSGNASQLVQHHEVTIGQLCKAKYGSNCITIGQLTNTGTVMAANEWDGPHAVMTVNPALDNSMEQLCHSISHQSGRQQFLMDLNQKEVIEILQELYQDPQREDKEHYIMMNKQKHHLLLQRAIGVIYRPSTERYSHYYYTQVEKQFDLLIYIDHTSAITPVDMIEPFTAEMETYPTGL